jgi:hypothetical protein
LRQSACNLTPWPSIISSALPDAANAGSELRLHLPAWSFYQAERRFHKRQLRRLLYPIFHRRDQGSITHMCMTDLPFFQNDVHFPENKTLCKGAEG